MAETKSQRSTTVTTKIAEAQESSREGSHDDELRRKASVRDITVSMKDSPETPSTPVPEGTRRGSRVYPEKVVSPNMDVDQWSSPGSTQELTPVDDDHRNGDINKKAWIIEKDADQTPDCDCVPNLWCQPEDKASKAVTKLVLCVFAGIVFGFCLEKSRVFEPASIRLQMVFKRWIMLKMFLAAVASGQLILSLLSLLPWTKKRFDEALTNYQGCFSTKGFITSVVGAFALGAGMTLSGACPGMVLAQVGAWAKNSIFTFVGVLIGALVYGVFATPIVKFTTPKNPIKIHTIHQKLKVSYAVVALPMSLLIIVIVVLMEIFINWKDDLTFYNQNGNWTEETENPFTVKSWPPSASGAIIGVLQLVIVFTVTDTLGGSSSYVTMVSQWVVSKRSKEWFPYLARARCGIGNWWQVFYVCGAILGGLFSSLLSDSLATTKGVSIPSALFGGILMLLGARFAAGCTSGHGLSGMGLLFWLSFVAVPAMFAGGIVTAYSMQASGALDDWHCHEKYKYMCLYD